MRAGIGTIIFTIFIPGAVTVLVPWLLLRGRTHPLDTPFLIAGSVLIGTGAAIYAHCAWEFVRRGRGTPAPWAAPTRLVVAGLYRWSRNPMYVGVVIILLGEAVACLSPALMVYALLVWLGFHLRILLSEEPVLRGSFGEDYRQYCRMVPRWLPHACTRRRM